MRDPVPALDHAAARDARRMDLVDQAIEPPPANVDAHLPLDVLARVVIGHLFEEVRMAPGEVRDLGDLKVTPYREGG